MPISGVENEKKEAEMSNKPTVYTNARYKMYPHSVVKEVATGACFPLVPGAPEAAAFRGLSARSGQRQRAVPGIEPAAGQGAGQGYGPLQSL